MTPFDDLTDAEKWLGQFASGPMSVLVMAPSQEAETFTLDWEYHHSHPMLWLVVFSAYWPLAAVNPPSVR